MPDRDPSTPENPDTAPRDASKRPDPHDHHESLVGPGQGAPEGDPSPDFPATDDVE